MTRPAWAGPRDVSVFVNCPFDDDYRASLDAIIFACVHAGFFPWMAGSTGDVSVPRVQRILEALSSCQYSIHDLTRYQGEGSENLGRFNMPLELGMAMAVGWSNPGEQDHDWMVMVPEGHVYQRYISDLAGFDPKTHDGSAQRVAVAVLSWLVTRPAALAVGPKEVLLKLPEYSRRKRQLDDDWGSNPPWGRVIELAVGIARS